MKHSPQRSTHEKNKVKFLLVMSLVLPAVYFGSVTEAAAYCIYNHTDRTIVVNQTYGGSELRSFSVTIKPGKDACCNWKTSDCNSEGKRTSTVKFNVKHGYKDVPYEEELYICKDFKIKAGGWLTVTGKGNDDPNVETSKCHAHFE